MPASTERDEYSVETGGASGVAVGRGASARVEGDATQSRMLDLLIQTRDLSRDNRGKLDQIEGQTRDNKGKLDQIEKQISEMLPVMKEIRDLKDDQRRQWAAIVLFGIIGTLAFIGVAWLLFAILGG